MTTLRRITAGKYATLDGAYEIIHDPDGYNHRLLGGRTGWLIYERGGDIPIAPGGDMPYPTLSDARLFLTDLLTQTHMTTTQALKLRSEAGQALAETLRGLRGAERVEALRECRKAGIGASELAGLAGISRARLYQLING